MESLPGCALFSPEQMVRSAREVTNAEGQMAFRTLVVAWPGPRS